jgi:hypothetical protein
LGQPAEMVGKRHGSPSCPSRIVRIDDAITTLSLAVQGVW